MRTIAKLFGRSPFGMLQAHMEKVSDCVAVADRALDAFLAGDTSKAEQFATEVSKLEHLADQVKNDIRNHLPKSLFLPIDRNVLLEILGIQDSIADTCENIAVLLTLKAMKPMTWMNESFSTFRTKNRLAFEKAHDIVKELDQLIEYSFGGAEAEKVKTMVDEVALLEHEADVTQRALLKGAFEYESQMTHGEFYLWMRIFREVGQVSNLAEKLANRLRMTVERK